MKNINADISDSLYITWSDDRQATSPKSLKEWVSTHPVHADMLIQWAADEVVAESAAAYKVSAAEETQAREIVKRTAAQMRARMDAPLRSLLATARQQGLDADMLAEQLELSEPLIMKLERRLIRVATMPAQLMQRVADALRLTTQQVQAYLALPPTLANGVSYRSETVPQAAQQDFKQAVRNDYELTDDQKAFWLTTLPEGTDESA